MTTTPTITIHRGENQIGGTVIEIATDTTAILLDAGENLPGNVNASEFDLDKLLSEKHIDAVIISHGHFDHFGLLTKLDFKKHPIPVYMGDLAYRVYLESQEYVHPLQPLPFQLAGVLSNGCTFCCGDIQITPYLADHSAFDAYSLLVEAGGKQIFYTGDFRGHGRKSFDRYISSLSTGIDILITEGTTLSRPDHVMLTESDLEEEAVRLMREKKGPVFVLQSATNIDRIVTMYRASKRSRRVFLQELYMASITKTIGGNIPNAETFEDVYAFTAKPLDQTVPEQNALYEALRFFGRKSIAMKDIATRHFTMYIRQSMEIYLRKLSKMMSFSDGLLIYSMWDGYKTDPKMQAFLDLAVSLGLEIVDIHASGHADAAALNRLINKLNPKQIIPVHTEHAEWFKQNWPL
ncbi:MBL fold hydrolase [Clostridia bacterium]|nr:MBL fold hydrolase [Clostridia bacterium]